MGQNPSCFSTGTEPERKSMNSRGITMGSHRSHASGLLDFAPSHNRTSSTSRSTTDGKPSGKPSSGHMKTWTADSMNDESDDATEKNSGYVLVDLKGDKIVHVDQVYLIGCEIYAPGLGIGLIVTCMTETKYTIHYKVQMADGRNIVVSIRKCDDFQLAAGTNLNPRIFVMQRLY